MIAKIANKFMSIDGNGESMKLAVAILEIPNPLIHK